MTVIEADYVVIGAGAMGMAFVDTLLTETADDVDVVMVDRYDQPGGHWTTAYPHVRLHQPSAFYGVNSRELGSGRIDEVGGNAGLYELASGAEVVAYFDQVMRQRFLPSGRVTHLRRADWTPVDGTRSGLVRSLVTGAETEVRARRRVVDATYMRVEVPSMRPAPFAVAEGVDCIPPNGLGRARGPRSRHVVVGGGKTGIDACLWLLDRGVPADAISWVVPRDSWLLDRARVQPGDRFFPAIATGQIAQGQAVLEATDVDDLFSRLEAAGQLLRLDPSVRPRMYRCATVSIAELEQLRTITDVVRLGHVQRVEPGAMVLDGETVAMPDDVLYVDCTADGLARRPDVPVFADGLLTLQTVRTCQQVFSAAFTAKVEATYDDDAVKNDICRPVPHPDTDLDWLRTQLENERNAMRWTDEDELRRWLADHRLNYFRNLIAPLPTDPTERAAHLGFVRDMFALQSNALGRLLADAGAPRP